MKPFRQSSPGVDEFAEAYNDDLALFVVTGGLGSAAYSTAQGLRAAYVAGAQGIRISALSAVARGESLQKAARSAVEARNALKLQFREPLPGLPRRAIELRNLRRYGNPVGPSFDDFVSAGRATSRSFRVRGGPIRCSTSC